MEAFFKQWLSIAIAYGGIGVMLLAFDKSGLFGRGPDNHIAANALPVYLVFGGCLSAAFAFMAANRVWRSANTTAQATATTADRCLRVAGALLVSIFASYVSTFVVASVLNLNDSGPKFWFIFVAWSVIFSAVQIGYDRKLNSLLCENNVTGTLLQRLGPIGTLIVVYLFVIVCVTAVRAVGHSSTNDDFLYELNHPYGDTGPY
jgi:hypothetical protein